MEVDENVIGLHLLDDHEEHERYEQDPDKEDCFMDEHFEGNENIEGDDRENETDVEEPASIPRTPKQLSRPLRCKPSSFALGLYFSS